MYKECRFIVAAKGNLDERERPSSTKREGRLPHGSTAALHTNVSVLLVRQIIVPSKL